MISMIKEASSCLVASKALLLSLLYLLYVYFRYFSKCPFFYCEFVSMFVCNIFIFSLFVSFSNISIFHSPEFCWMKNKTNQNEQKHFISSNWQLQVSKRSNHDRNASILYRRAIISSLFITIVNYLRSKLHLQFWQCH